MTLYFIRRIVFNSLYDICIMLIRQSCKKNVKKSEIVRDVQRWFVLLLTYNHIQTLA